MGKICAASVNTARCLWLAEGPITKCVVRQFGMSIASGLWDRRLADLLTSIPTREFSDRVVRKDWLRRSSSPRSWEQVLSGQCGRWSAGSLARQEEPAPRLEREPLARLKLGVEGDPHEGHGPRQNTCSLRNVEDLQIDHRVNIWRWTVSSWPNPFDPRFAAMFGRIA